MPRYETAVHSDSSSLWLLLNETSPFLSFSTEEVWWLTYWPLAACVRRIVALSFFSSVGSTEAWETCLSKLRPADDRCSCLIERRQNCISIQWQLFRCLVGTGTALSTDFRPQVFGLLNENFVLRSFTLSSGQFIIAAFPISGLNLNFERRNPNSFVNSIP